MTEVDDDYESLEDVTPQTPAKALQIAMRLAEDRVHAAESEWPTLPQHMNTSDDYEKFSCASDYAMRLLDSAFHVAQSYNPIPADLSRLQQAVALVSDEYSEFLFTHSSEFSTETQLTRGDLPSSWFPAIQICSYIYIVARMSVVALAPPSNSKNITQFRKLDALCFEGIARQGLAQSIRPICEYTATDLVWAFDALSRAWFFIEHSPSIDAYVLALTVRAGMFLRTCATMEEFGDDKTLRSTPSSEKVWCSPTRMFQSIIAARVCSFAGAAWRVNLYNHPTQDQFSRFIVENAQTRAVAAAGPRRKPMRVPTPLDPRFGALNIAELLLRYCTESATSEVSADLFSKRMVDFSLRPGDQGVFVARHKHTSPTAGNIIRLIRGERFHREMEIRAKKIGPDVPLKAAVERLRKGIGHPCSSRSDALLDEEVAAICVLDTLFKNRYGVEWITDYFVTGQNHTALTESGAVPTSETALADTDEMCLRLPRIAMLCNTFDVLYEGCRLRTRSVFESIAWWLDIVATVYGGSVPTHMQEHSSHLAPDKKRRFQDENMDSSLPLVQLHNISDICAVVRRGHQTYTVRTSGDDITKYGTANICGDSVPVIFGT
jgi:hypothetical protein